MKAQVDIIYLMSLLFGVLIGVLIWITVWGQFTASIPANNLFHNTTQGLAAENSATTATDTMANAIVFVYVFANLAALVAAFFANSNPVFAVLGVIVFPIELIFSFIFHDAFFLIMSNSFLSGTLAAFPIIGTFMQGLPFVVGIFAVATIIVTFGK